MSLRRTPRSLGVRVWGAGCRSERDSGKCRGERGAGDPAGPLPGEGPSPAPCPEVASPSTLSVPLRTPRVALGDLSTVFVAPAAARNWLVWRLSLWGGVLVLVPLSVECLVPRAGRARGGVSGG